MCPQAILLEVFQSSSAIIYACILLSILFVTKWHNDRYLSMQKLIATNGGHQNNQIIPVSVNYHFTRVCNYECGFCFHTAKTSFLMDLENAKKGLEMLRNAGKYQIFKILCYSTCIVT